MDYNVPCKYGKLQSYIGSLVKVIVCEDNRVCCFQHFCKTCSHYKMIDSYDSKCKKYIDNENK